MLAIAVIVTAVYFRVVGLGSTTWDDRALVLDNARLSPASWANLRSFWSEGRSHLYAPVTFSFYLLETILAEETDFLLPARRNPAVYHFGNLALHVAVSVLVFLLLLRLVGQDVPAAVGTLLFALHPTAAGRKRRLDQRNERTIGGILRHDRNLVLPAV